MAGSVVCVSSRCVQSLCSIGHKSAPKSTRTNSFSTPARCSATKYGSECSAAVTCRPSDHHTRSFICKLLRKLLAHEVSSVSKQCSSQTRQTNCKKTRQLIKTHRDYQRAGRSAHPSIPDRVTDEGRRSVLGHSLGRIMRGQVHCVQAGLPPHLHAAAAVREPGTQQQAAA